MKDIFGNDIIPGNSVVFMPKGSRAWTKLAYGEVIGFTTKQVRVITKSNIALQKQMEETARKLGRPLRSRLPEHELVHSDNVAVWPGKLTV